ncbi:MAG: flavodoxin family protein, partial [Spirochaetales bacterium]|nr:flavodoxin family protein [Spirochaetales bacterium]
MSKSIMILNGAARKNGSTQKLIQSFSDGARSAGHHVREFYLDGMNIHSCKGCLKAGRDSKSPCSQKDDMEQIYSAFSDCD